MREQLIQYVDLLFGGVPDSEEMKQEILQNTLDRYDDLVSQGKSPEAAYRLAISGIGDINEILGNEQPVHEASSVENSVPRKQEPQEPSSRKLIRAIAIGLYIICMIPLFILSEMGMDTLGLCATLSIIAVATVALILGGKKEQPQTEEHPYSPQKELCKSIGSIVWTIATVLYLVISFVTQAWAVTWLIFLIAKCVISLIRAIMDFKEATEYEN